MFCGKHRNFDYSASIAYCVFAKPIGNGGTACCCLGWVARGSSVMPIAEPPKVIDLTIHSENIVRRHWRDFTAADREELNELVSNDLDDAAEDSDRSKQLVVRGSLAAVICETSE